MSVSSIQHAWQGVVAANDWLRRRFVLLHPLRKGDCHAYSSSHLWSSLYVHDRLNTCIPRVHMIYHLRLSSAIPLLANRQHRRFCAGFAAYATMIFLVVSQFDPPILGRSASCELGIGATWLLSWTWKIKEAMSRL